MRVRVIDVETTGDKPPAQVVEIGYCDVIQTDAGWILNGPPVSQLVNPGVPIPPDMSAIHHIVDEDVAGAPTLAEIGPSIFGPEAPGEYLAAHNAKFERQFITDEMTGGKPWACTYKCSLRLWKDAPSHSNQALRYWRKPEGLDRQIAALSHRAGPDAYVTAHHLRDMLNGGALLEHLIARSSQPALLINCHIGKFRGKKWADVDVGFLRWMLDKDFDEDVKFTARHWIAQHERKSVHDDNSQTQPA